MKKLKDGFSFNRAIIALAVFGIATTSLSVALQAVCSKNERTCALSNSEKSLLSKLYTRYKIANAAYAFDSYDPYCLDLNGDGFIEISAPKDGIYFDFNGDGFAEKMAWVMDGDGILAIDLDQNGKIDNGDEIVKEGDLRIMDTNEDGVISKEDKFFELFRVVKSDGSVKTLAEENIKEIKLKTTPFDEFDRYDNHKFGEGSFVKTNGKTYRYDLYVLMADFYDSQEVDVVEVLPAVKKLPNIKCQGTVHSLHQTMMKDHDLKVLVEKFMKEKNDEKRLELSSKILKQWVIAGSSDKNTKSNVVVEGVTDPDHLRIVEELMGYRYNPEKKEVITPEMKVFSESQIETIYLRLENYVYASLMRQTYLADLSKLIKTNKNKQTDFSAVRDKLQKELDANPEVAKQRILQFARMVKGLGLDKNSNFLDPKDPDCFYLKFTENDRDLKWKIDSTAKIPLILEKAKIKDGQLWGTQGEDAYFAKPGDLSYTNFIHSRYGADTLYGSAKSDTLVACQDDDLLDGGDGDDILIANTQNDIIFGGNGNDRIYAGEDNDIIFGGDGDDLIYPDATDTTGGVNLTDHGNDIIVGGKGNDIIYSEVGNDLFIFNLGDGNDTIYEKEGTDTLYFGKGISWKNLVFEKVGNDMVIKIKNSFDSIVVKDWFAPGQVGEKNNIIENFEFADGSKYTHKNIRLK